MTRPCEPAEPLPTRHETLLALLVGAPIVCAEGLGGRFVRKACLRPETDVTNR